MHHARRLSAGILVVATALGACSSSHKSSPPTSTTAAASTSTIANTTTSSVAPATTVAVSTTLPAPSTTVASNTTVHIDKFTAQPASVQCNAPSMIELSWSVRGATKVTLALDGTLLASFGGGSHTGLYPIPCDGGSHTYLLTATAGSARATSSVTVPTHKL